MRLIKMIGRRLGVWGQEEEEETRPSEEPEQQHSRFGDFQLEPCSAGGLPRFPRLRDVPLEKRQDLFRCKLELCSEVFDFCDDSRTLEKELKQKVLMELVDYANITFDCFSNSLMELVVNMIGLNIFHSMRTLDAEYRTLARADGIEVPPDAVMSPDWSHRQIVYEFFLRFASSDYVDTTIAAKFLDEAFIVNFVELFDSENPRERTYLKNILHRIYGKFVVLRGCIRHAIRQTLFKVVHRSEEVRGIAELLEIMGSVIVGLSLPLKDEHKGFLLTTLVPLHKVQFVASFGVQLSDCTVQYVEKDPQLAYDVITTMLRFWPVTNTPKQLLFLSVFEDTLEFTRVPEFCQMQVPLFRRLALCIACQHFQVAERVLLFWRNGCIVRLINQSREDIFPLIIGALLRNVRQHWHPVVSELTSGVLKSMDEADPSLFQRCLAQHDKDSDATERRNEVRKQRWDRVRALHDANVFFGNRA